MAEPALRLVHTDEGLVDTQSGERLGECPSCRELEDQLDGAESNVRSMRAKMANLKRDKEASMLGHELFPKVQRIFAYWQERCNHPNTDLDPARFEQIEAVLTRMTKRHGEEEAYWMCLTAIEGAVFQPYTKRRRNGSVERFDLIRNIFGTQEKFEAHVNRAPREWLAERVKEATA